MEKKITKRAQTEFLRGKLATDKTWALRGLTVIYNNQTDDEQAVNRTRHSNRRGFNRRDAATLSVLAKQHISGFELKETEMAQVFEAMPKYAWQIRHRTAFNEAVLLKAMTKKAGKAKA